MIIRKQKYIPIEDKILHNILKNLGGVFFHSFFLKIFFFFLKLSFFGKNCQDLDNFFRQNDLFVIDRGFRDALLFLQNKGYN